MSSAASTFDRSIFQDGYRTTPDHETSGWPPGVPYIIGNEACERFSFYGMRAILYAHLLSLFVITHAVADAVKEATGVVHLFFAGVYALPMIGAIIADRLAGKYQTILYLSLVYCAGHAVLSLGENSLTGMYIGLTLIAVGSGGIKPCVSANVGDQFGKNNWFRIRTIYQIFYFSVNFGSFFSTLLIPVFKTHSGHWVASAWPGVTQHIAPERLGTSIAFGIPGVLMFIATLIFWMGRKKFVHVPPKPGGNLGLLDTLSSSCLFLTVGHLFISASWEWWKIMLLSGFFLAAGLALFAWRQKLKPDDGFLAITLYAIWTRIRGKPGESESLVEVQRQPPTAPGLDVQRGETPVGIKKGPSFHVTADRSEKGPPPDPGDHQSGSVSSTSEDSHEGTRDPFSGPLAGHWLWAPAVRRYGHEAVEGPVAVFKIISVFILVSVFWALFDQHSSTWIEQARHMNRTVNLPMAGTFTLEATQIPATNPLMVMLLIPLMNFVYVGFDSIGLRTTPLRRITVGMLVTASSFAAIAIIQSWIDTYGPGTVNIAWQLIPYLLLTVGEVMVSITGLEFAYTQAPRRMKSTVMGFWLLTVTLGNVLVVFLAGFKGLALVKFFWIFAGLMAGAGLIFGIRAYFYAPRDYAQ